MDKSCVHPLYTHGRLSQPIRNDILHRYFFMIGLYFFQLSNNFTVLFLIIFIPFLQYIFIIWLHFFTCPLLQYLKLVYICDTYIKYFNLAKYLLVHYFTNAQAYISFRNNYFTLYIYMCVCVCVILIYSIKNNLFSLYMIMHLLLAYFNLHYLFNIYLVTDILFIDQIKSHSYII
jgi:hypothetical protein